MLNYTDSNEFLTVALDPQGEFAVFNVAGSGSFNFEAVLVGQMKLKDIGFIIPMTVPVSVKGTMIVREKMLFDANDNIAGASTVSASLNLSATKYANDNDLTPDQIVITGDGIKEGLIQTLQGKGFVPATMPAP